MKLDLIMKGNGLEAKEMDMVFIKIQNKKFSKVIR